jgi:tetratricopeptide (TPR) repeat protein
VETGLRLAGALYPFWERHNHFSEGRGWLEAFLARQEHSRPAAAPRLQAKALYAAGMLAFRQDEYRRTVALGERSLAVSRDCGDTAGIARALHSMAVALYFQDEYVRAQALLEESLALGRELDDAWGIADALHVLAGLAQAQGDYARAAALWEEGLALRERVRDPWLIAYLLANLGDNVRVQGDARRAEALYHEALSLRRAVGDTRGVAGCLFFLGWLAQERGDYGQARALYAESIPLFQSVGVAWTVAYMLGGLAGIACAWGQEERAVWLYGAATALRDAVGGATFPDRLAARDRDISALRSALGEEAFAAAWAAGQALPLDQAIAEALGMEDTEPAAHRQPGPRKEGTHAGPEDDTAALPLHALLRATRQAHGLSLAAVGALFGVSHVIVSRWEAGPEPDHTGTVRGRPIPSEVVPLLQRWIETGAPPSAEDLAARRTARPGVHPATGKPWKPAGV